MTPIELLFERSGLPTYGIQAPLAVRYGGDFGLARPGLYANFVASVDGIVALPGPRDSGQVISGANEPDRFVMALLRATADAVIIGAGTFRKMKGAFLRAEAIFPEARKGFADLRRKLGLRVHPLLVVVTGSGRIAPSQPALGDALIVTTPAGERNLRGKLPPGARVAVLESAPFASRSLTKLLAAEGLEVLLAEGGPSLVGPLLRDGLVDELFLTSSPLLFGRMAGSRRKTLVDGVDLGGRALDLLSVRRHQSHLFLRYRVLGAPNPPT
ncbi:hypothetical protein LBMAG42_34360 [Deltaproteobacteria bacterium]|nr:hypothetical protein LBMAG42_34360 [Deltaproteobacteria bacterium]